MGRGSGQAGATLLGHLRLESLLPQDLQAAVPRVAVLVCLQPLQDTNQVLTGLLSGQGPSSLGPSPYLHPGLDHIQWGVPKDTGSSRDGPKDPSDERVHGLVGVVAWMWAGQGRVWGQRVLRRRKGSGGGQGWEEGCAEARQAYLGTSCAGKS